MSLSLRQIRYFVATAEYGQISLASAELRISQSAITTAIKDLEQTVGLELFNRSAQGMDLTTAGRQFLFHAYDILNKVNEATNLLLPAGDFSGELTVAASYTVFGYFLPQHLGRLRRAWPNLSIQLFELNREAIEEGLLANRYDMAVLLTSNVINPDLTTETLMSSRRRLWVPARHSLLTKEAVGLRHIVEEPYIMLTVDEAAHTSLRYWSTTPYRPNVTLRTSSVEAVRSLVADGHGVTILSDMVLRPWSLEGKRIETIVPTEPIPSMDVGLAWRRNAQFTPAMEAFRAYFHQTFFLPSNR
ncbi:MULTISPECIES: LysR family transcriptional regulator [unclassified Phyllobacterium]|uniref:LysR family transcriptional regulator n=1 Tax=Phyllobacterium TaxID=28100 RepID=UPI0015F90BBC|nr:MULTISPECIES: LysR family transcriptional regulator [unclassified Phyllobacterium]MBA8903046.1 DNA-binding transcriptional LysR family regulator [Phyllobacterium sp. P30BS-XVII]UGX89206.1 LysR family transcriptional regulator [Phyllobacterium sp. T1293]